MTPFSERITRLCEQLEAKGIDAALITDDAKSIT
jgi:hypothetical protein